jgi:hypothetical protein
MKLIKVGAAVLNQTPLDWDGNKARIQAAIAAARADGVTALCLPCWPRRPRWWRSCCPRPGTWWSPSGCR